MTDIHHFIGGRQVPGGGDKWSPVVDPAHGHETGRVALGGPDEVHAAVESARSAQQAWARAPLAQRQQVVTALVRSIEEHRDELAELVSGEHGKTLGDARGEIDTALSVARFATGLPHLVKGDHSTDVSAGVDSHSVRRPLGVVAGIAPFNFPVLVPMCVFPMAVACGNAVVIKPSPKTPSAALLLARLALEVGLPAGVLNVVQGDKPVVDALIEHDAVAAITFVGSTPVAEQVYAGAARRGKRVQALGGAKNHLVVLPDADLDAAADGLVSGAFGSAGERCMAVSVGVAVGDVADRLRDRIVERMGRLVTGDGRDPASDMGPLVSREHLDRVRGYVDAGVAAGAELVVDGRDIAVTDRPDGFFLAPTLFDRVTPEMVVYREEIFGPVLSLVRVETFDDAVALVNANPFGNGVSLFTASGHAARRFENEVDPGMIGINVPIPIPVAYYAFGGQKRSRFGESGLFGEDGVRFFTRSKVVTSRWSAPTTGVDLRFSGSERAQ